MNNHPTGARIYAELPKGRGFVLRIGQEHYQGHPRVDCRVWYETRPGDPDTRRPTPKGINLSLRDLPGVLAALQQAAADALEAGHLRPEQFTRAGLNVPDLPRKAA
jgi:hypothetical protein